MRRAGTGDKLFPMLGRPSPPTVTNIHATCVAVASRGVILLGPSGTGKSDLALRLIERGAVLVADDRCDLWTEQGQLWCAPPEILAGRIEVRGVGIVENPFVAPAPVLLAVRLADRYERMPSHGLIEMVAGVAVPSLQMAAFEGTAPYKIELALAQQGGV